MARDTITTIEADFMAAIDRLIEGKPASPDLVQRAEAGLLVINFSTVALEAGRSRTLIAVEPARLPNVRRRILDLTAKSTEVLPDSDAISSLKKELEEVKAALWRSLQAQAEYCLQRDRAQRSSRRWREAFRRKIEEQKAASNVVDFPLR